MFIDASALVAILLKEPGADELVERFSSSSARSTSPLAVWEATLAVSRGLKLSVTDGRKTVEDYLHEMGIDLLALPPETASLALDAFDRYGKGRHPAALNFGDCFAYACAKHSRQPLLFKGDDFSQTDIEIA